MAHYIRALQPDELVPYMTGMLQGDAETINQFAEDGDMELNCTYYGKLIRTIHLLRDMGKVIEALEDVDEQGLTRIGRIVVDCEVIFDESKEEQGNAE